VERALGVPTTHHPPDHLFQGRMGATSECSPYVLLPRFILLYILSAARRNANYD
jgi:hypothetical protein